MDHGSISYQKYLSGDDQGMVALIRDYKDGLILFLNNLTGNLQLAEELAMDTFVHLGIKRPQNKQKASFKTWLYTIARHLAVDHFRKRSRRKEVPLEEGYGIADEQACIERLYQKNREKLAVHNGMKQLNDSYRQILWLVYFEDLSLKEAAKIMGKTTRATETLVYRARNALKNILAKEGFTYEGL